MNSIFHTLLFCGCAFAGITIVVIIIKMLGKIIKLLEKR